MGEEIRYYANKQVRVLVQEQGVEVIVHRSDKKRDSDNDSGGDQKIIRSNH